MRAGSAGKTSGRHCVPGVRHVDITRLHVEERLTIANPYRAVAGGRGQEGTEIPAEARREIENLFHGVVTCTSEALQQRVGGEGARIPVPALVLIERVPH